jgi:hypothetical protein
MHDHTKIWMFITVLAVLQTIAFILIISLQARVG